MSDDAAALTAALVDTPSVSGNEDQLAGAIERALAALKGGKPMAEGNAVDLDSFEEIVGMAGWQEVEKSFGSQ